ncbi:ABC-2 transporter permease [Oscillospiraceae bacterium OttesenSCG-928-G22]|nr:ABC-2 transporter permease [Oscillospiraceae bacterium OttesenSCG-928-G22]
MKGLILKDLYSMRQTLKMAAIIFVIWAVIFLPSGDGSFFLSCSVLMAAVVFLGTFSYEEAAKWAKYALTLPISRKKLIFSKYMTFLLLLLAALLLGFVVTTIGDVILRGGISPGLYESMFTSMCIGLLFGSIVLPLIYRFGIEKARIALIVVALVPTGVIALSNLAPGMLDTFFAKASALFGAGGPLHVLLYALPLVVLLLYYLSYLLSVRLYAKVDL